MSILVFHKPLFIPLRRQFFEAFERGDPIPLREAAWNDMARAAQNAAPSIKSLLSQEAELVTEIEKVMREISASDPNDASNPIRWYNRLEALIRRHHGT